MPAQQPVPDGHSAWSTALQQHPSLLVHVIIMLIMMMIMIGRTIMITFKFNRSSNSTPLAKSAHTQCNHHCNQWLNTHQLYSTHRWAATGSLWPSCPQGHWRNVFPCPPMPWFAEEQTIGSDRCCWIKQLMPLLCSSCSCMPQLPLITMLVTNCHEPCHRFSIAYIGMPSTRHACSCHLQCKMYSKWCSCMLQDQPTHEANVAYVPTYKQICMWM